MQIKLSYLTLAFIAISSVSGAIGYAMGWNAKGESVAEEVVNKKAKADEALKEPEQKAADAKAKADVVYKTVYRDVVKYVNNPDRTLCKFDDDAVSLRKQAIDAANNLPGFDADTVQDKRSSNQFR